MDRARGLDNKAAGLIGGATALIGASVAAGSRLTDLQASAAVQLIVGIALVVALTLLLVAGGLAAWAFRPQAYAAQHADEIKSFVTRSYLRQDPTQVEGTQLDGSVKAILKAREVNRRKAHRLGWAFRTFLVALVVTAGAGATLAVEGASDHGKPGKPRASGHIAGRH